jgi:hypothetical protein
MSLFPCRRAHPARGVRRLSQCATAHTAFAFPVAGSASGAAHFRGHRCVRLRYSLETRHHPADGAVERLQRVGFPSPCAPSYRALAFPLVGFPPTEHTSLRWTHNRTYGFHRIRLSTFGRSPWGYHEASVSMSAASTGLHPCLIPFRQPTREHARGQLTRSRGTVFADSSLYSVLPKARGLRRGANSMWTALPSSDYYAPSDSP